MAAQSGKTLCYVWPCVPHYSFCPSPFLPPDHDSHNGKDMSQLSPICPQPAAQGLVHRRHLVNDSYYQCDYFEYIDLTLLRTLIAGEEERAWVGMTLELRPGG